jgi:predicted small metal-binding protein
MLQQLGNGLRDVYRYQLDAQRHPSDSGLRKSSADPAQVRPALQPYVGNCRVSTGTLAMVAARVLAAYFSPFAPVPTLERAIEHVQIRDGNMCSSVAIHWCSLCAPRELPEANPITEGKSPMTKVISCRDVGVDCDFVARGQTEQEILEQCAEHARTVHGMNELSPELAQKLRSGIREEEEKAA